MKIVVNQVITMVKQGAFQNELFNVQSAKGKVSTVKQSSDDAEILVDEKQIVEILEQQLALLHDIHYLLEKMDHNKKEKKRLFNFKKE